MGFVTCQSNVSHVFLRLIPAPPSLARLSFHLTQTISGRNQRDLRCVRTSLPGNIVCLRGLVIPRHTVATVLCLKDAAWNERGHIYNSTLTFCSPFPRETPPPVRQGPHAVACQPAVELPPHRIPPQRTERHEPALSEDLSVLPENTGNSCAFPAREPWRRHIEM